MKRLTNKKRWIGYLFEHSQITDGLTDRPKSTYVEKRKFFYNPLGITSNEKYLSAQNKSEVVKRIEMDLDRSVNEVDHRVKIGETMFKITRIWIDEREKRMELSLAYVSH